MTHAKDRSHRMLCNGCSPFDSSATTTYVHLWTLCPSCSASSDSRDLPGITHARPRFHFHGGLAAAAAVVAAALV